MTVRITRGMVLLAAACLVACSPPPDEPSGPVATPSISSGTGTATGTGTGTATGSPTASASSQPGPGPTLPAVPAWQAGEGEVSPEVKQTATALLERAGTWTGAGGGSPEAMLARLQEAAPATRAFVAGLAPLQEPSASAATVTVIYPQYGGLTRSASSVMTLVAQRLVAPDGTESVRELVLDVRLERGPQGWRVIEIVPTTPALAGPGTLGPAATAVLENPNVRLPASAAADLRTGALDEGMLAILDGLAQDHVVDVAVFYDGHPTNVFETDRVSNHHVGRAVDIWRVDGRTIASATQDRALLDPILVRAAELGATEVGGPYDLNGDGPGYFTDAVHQDHLHIGVSAGRPPARP